MVRIRSGARPICTPTQTKLIQFVRGVVCVYTFQKKNKARPAREKKDVCAVRAPNMTMQEEVFGLLFCPV